MAPRLNHRKSRAGCLLCKKRKIKCSEDKPECTACAKHGVRCEYETVPQPRRKRETSNKLEGEASTSSSITPDPSSTGFGDPYEADFLDVTPDYRKQIELFLLHRFTCVVSSTFPSAESVLLHHVYSRDAVQLSFSFPFLQNTILAITALYTALQQSSDRSISDIAVPRIPPVFESLDFAQVHRVYMNLAIQQQRLSLGEIDARNADALGLTSIMLSMMAGRLLSVSEPGAIYSPPVQALYIAEATGPIIHSSTTHLPPDSPMRKIMELGGTNLGSVFQGESPNDKSALFDLHEANRFQHILDFEDVNDVERRTTEATMAYTGALAFIGGIHAAIQRRDLDHQICRRIMSFAPVVPSHFIQLLGEKRPRALVIFAHFMALNKRVERYWWLHGAAERDVKGIASILPEAWKWAMEWPLEMISHLATQSPMVNV